MKRLLSRVRASKQTPSTACWICGAVAASGEHRIKKADLARAYGKGPYRGSSAPVHVRDGVICPVQGPDSKTMKYRPSICQRCNTTTTQPFDAAYDRFGSWLAANEATVLRRRMIDFAEVYGAEFEDGQRNLFKYFVKSFGCRLVDAGRPVPRDLVALLPRRSFVTALKITLCVNEDVLLLPAATRIGFIGKGDLSARLKKSDPSVALGFTWEEHVSWFTVCYWYAVQPEPRLGSVWIADAQCVYLGAVARVSPDTVVARVRRRAARAG